MKEMDAVVCIFGLLLPFALIGLFVTLAGVWMFIKYCLGI